MVGEAGEDGDHIHLASLTAPMAWDQEWREGSPAWIKNGVLTNPQGWHFNY